MESNSSGMQIPLQPIENQVFPGVTISPAQQYLLKQNLEKSRQKVKEEKDPYPQEYNYIFTRNYIIVSSILIVVAFVVFGIIIYLQLTRFSSQ